MNHRLTLLIGLAGGCFDVKPADGTDSGTTPTTDDACGPDVSPLPIAPCVETTADRPTFTGWSAADVVGGTGTVIEVGGDLDDVPGSEPFGRSGVFPACGAEHVQQVRMLDGYGETWTFGWDVEGTLDDTSSAAVVVGAELGFLATYETGPYNIDGAFVLTDDLGPLFLYEIGPTLTEEERGGIGVAIGYDDTCIVNSENSQEEHYLVSYTWAGGQADLRSGQSTPIPLPGRDVELVLGVSSWMLGCADGCGSSEWAAWAEVP